MKTPATIKFFVCFFAMLIVFSFVASMPAAAQFVDPPNGSQFTLEGCRNNGQIPLYTNSALPLLCADTVYTTGNLQKGWNELDLVPYRLTAKAGGSGTQKYDVYIGADFTLSSLNPLPPCGDNQPNTVNCGYDIITDPATNTSLSDNSGAQCSITAAAQFVQKGITGGTAYTLLRDFTIIQPAGVTCVFDWDERLALGSASFSGSNLQAYMFQTDVANGGSTVGKKTVPTPVNQIQPQQLSKTMTASQGADHVWTVDKKITGVSGLPNTCSTAADALQGSVTVTIDWAKQAAVPGGDITVTATITVTNPASRVIDATVTDKVYEGTDATGTLVHTMPFAPVQVPAASGGIAGQVVLTDTFSDSNQSATNFFDVATATYTDDLTQLPIPGNTQATASAAVQAGSSVTNQTASINDVETLTDPLKLLTFAVESVTPNAGSFEGGYTLGTYATSVTYDSPSLSSASNATDSGTIVFQKNIKASQAGAATTATLADTATLTGSDGFQAPPATASTPIAADVSVTLTINKTLTTSGSGSFVFHIYNSNGRGQGGNTLGTELGACLTADPTEACSPKTIMITNGTTGSATVANLPADSYDVTEDAATGFVPNTQNPQNADLRTNATTGLTPCTGHVDFSNTPEGNIIVYKHTTPAGSSQKFTFTPTYNSGTTFDLSDGQHNDSGPLAPGGYSVSEAEPTGWTPSQAASCSDGTNTYDPSNITLGAGKTVTCNFYNTQEATIIIQKVTNPDPDTTNTSFAYTTTGTGLSGFSLKDNGSKEFDNLVPGSGYAVTETLNTANTGFGFTSVSCSALGSSTTSTAGSKVSITLAAGDTVTCKYTNSTSFVKVNKTFKLGPLPAGACGTGTNLINPCQFTFELFYGADSTHQGTLLETEVVSAANDPAAFSTALVPGKTYEMCEVLPDAGWMTNIGPSPFVYPQSGGANNIICAAFTPTAGQTSTLTIDNTPPPGGLGFTIGFWKNWSSCSGGKQGHTLDKTLFDAQSENLLWLATGPGPGIAVGNLALYTSPTRDPDTFCGVAVDVLSKSSIKGNNFASNPAYNMAAQLLGAELNIAALSGVNACVLLDIESANNLLTPVKDGAGNTGVDFSKNFSANTAPKLTTLQTNDANYLQTQLNAFNNNQPVQCSSQFLF